MSRGIARSAKTLLPQEDVHIEGFEGYLAVVEGESTPKGDFPPFQKLALQKGGRNNRKYY
jgi:hypothetical protein